mgnify:CR=1 FL=1
MNTQLYLDANWQTDFILGDYIIVQAYRAMDPTTWTKVYNEPWLKHYVSALFKKQWGTNLKKFSGIQLPGGVTLDGDKLYSEAIDEIEKLNPKPGGSFDGNQKMIEHIVPDFTIRIVDGELELLLNGRNAPELHVSKDYQEMLQSYKDTSEKSNSQKDAVQFIKQKLDSAKWAFAACILGILKMKCTCV